ncbi:MAG: hypothetical protein ACTHNO_02640 [Ralstonia sp.]|uniref:hypothetical protein n=1 Tax=Ralstonia sp. TaxID=54061 RepID=UPI003F81B3DA
MATTIYVAFTDASKATIDSVFANVQPVESFPYQNGVPSDDPRYVAYYDKFTGLFPNLVDVLVKPGT